MAENSKIEWTDATWNPITGCSVHSPGCTNCYAMKLAGTRLKNHPSRIGLTRDTKAGPVWTGEVRFNEQWLLQPLQWKRPRMIFVCAHADLFHEDVQDEWIDRIFAVMALAPQHIFQVLTKRADRMRAYVARLRDRAASDKWSERDPHGVLADLEECRWPLPNVWLGVSVEDQKRAEERIPHLLATPAAVRWLSCEPLLGPVDLDFIDLSFAEAREREPSGLVSVRALDGLHFDGEGAVEGVHGSPDPHIDWVVCGGESGPAARPMHPNWARSLRDQCAAAGVPFHFKQWGEWRPSEDGDWQHGYEVATVMPQGGVREWHPDYPNARPTDPQMRPMVAVGKKAAGRFLDGVEHNGVPHV